MGQALSYGQHVSDEKRAAARRMRREPTAAEDLLWQALRRKQLGGLKFRRQQPVRGFIVDFYCESKDLAIELDGAVHDGVDAAAADRERQAQLEAQGIRFLRFKNREVESDLPAVLTKILGT